MRRCPLALVGLVLSFAFGQGLAADDLHATVLHADVLVLGSEPEGIIAAVAAAQEGARTLLVTPHERLGGLFVTGQMNALDLRTRPRLLQRGLFEAWWWRVGRGSAFDVRRAEEAFEAMLLAAGVEVVRNAGKMAAALEGERAIGVRFGERTLYARQLIDATPEADIAAAAGAPYTVGFASLGVNARMADTLVFRIDGVDWPRLTREVKGRGRGYAEINSHAAWGDFGGYPARYETVEEGIRLRGLNLGRQEDGSVLVNALLIYGVDPFDPASRAEGKARAAREAPRIVAYLRSGVPGFEEALSGGVAETLYIRESRHLEALCTLSADDVLDNVVTELDVAAGGYPLDVQTLTPNDHGYVFGLPEVYGVRLCVAVPKGVDNLWVVGKAAGYDPLAASSARVVPMGMALGEAVGVAAARATEASVTPAAFATSREHVLALRERLLARGAYLPEVRERTPVGPHEHEFFPAYRLLLGRGLAVGGYDNNPRLDEKIAALDFLYLLSGVARRFHGDDRLGPDLVAKHGMPSGPLTSELALALTQGAACLLGVCPPQAWEALKERGLAPPRFPPQDALTKGEAYALAAALAGLEVGIVQSDD
jgi:hypothetical protein